jgi:hypothetical protein
MRGSHAVDANADTVFSRAAGTRRRAADLLDAVAVASARRRDCLQVVEHLPPAALVRFLELAHAALIPGGLLVIETINPVSPAALRHYFADLTHAQPLVAETLQLLVQGAGFHDVELRWLNAPPPHDDPRISEQLFARRSTTQSSALPEAGRPRGRARRRPLA